MSMKKFKNSRHGATPKRKKRFLNLITRADIVAQNETIIESIRNLRRQFRSDEHIRIYIKPYVVQKQYTIIVSSDSNPRHKVKTTITLDLDPFESYWETTKKAIQKEFNLLNCEKGEARSYEFYWFFLYNKSSAMPSFCCTIH